MAIVERVKNICLKPKLEWPVIAAEPTTAGGLIAGYVAPLVAVGAIAGLIGRSVIGVSVPFMGSYRVPLTAGLVTAIVTFVMAVVGVFVLSLIINALAPTFSGQKNSAQALKLAVYSYTPAWVAGVLQLIPALGILGVLAGLYGLYLLYLGLPRLMNCPQEKAGPYTAVVVVCAIVLTVIIGAIGAAVAGAGGMMGATAGAYRTAGSRSEVQFDKDSPLGKLQALGKQMEASGKKMEAAQKSGDPKEQMQAAMEGLGTLFGGGKRVEAIAIDQLKAFVPDTFAGLPKKSSNAEKNGLAGLKVSKAEATYGDGAQKRVTLAISDSGGASGLLGLAGWAGLQGEKEDDNGSERTDKVDGRIVHEKVSKTGGSNEFEIVLGDRFIVSATGHGVGIGDLKSALSGLELAKLEAMKDVGIAK